MKICPKCGNKKFYVTAHVTQDWIVDETGDYIDTVEECGQVTHYPDDDDMWTCVECGYEASGEEFEAKEEEKKESNIDDLKGVIDTFSLETGLNTDRIEIFHEEDLKYGIDIDGIPWSNQLTYEELEDEIYSLLKGISIGSGVAWRRE